MDIKKMTNTQFVKHVMEIGGRTGMMKQLFIIDAIGKHCDKVIANQEAILAQEEEDEKEGKSSLISMRAWVEAAKEIKEMIDEKYG